MCEAQAVQQTMIATFATQHQRFCDLYLVEIIGVPRFDSAVRDIFGWRRRNEGAQLRARRGELSSSQPDPMALHSASWKTDTSPNG